jgi:hypothetical protein
MPVFEEMERLNPDFCAGTMKSVTQVIGDAQRAHH